jgi:hypothetical protein
VFPGVLIWSQRAYPALSTQAIQVRPLRPALRTKLLRDPT